MASNRSLESWASSRTPLSMKVRSPMSRSTTISAPVLSSARRRTAVADVEVVMREATALTSQDAVVGIVGGKAGNRGAEGLALLHAFQNEVHAMLPGPFHAAQGGTNIILLAYLRLGPFDGRVVAGKRLHPCLILVGPPRQHFLR